MKRRHVPFGLALCCALGVASCFRDLDFAPCQQDPSLAICHPNDASTDASETNESGACTSGELQCDGRNTLECGSDGRFSTTGACPFGCEKGKCFAVLQLAAGWNTSCGLIEDGTVRCWGQIAGAVVTTPKPVVGLANAVEIRMAGGTACARISDGTVRCWGDNRHGALGDGSTVNQSIPVTVVGLSAVSELALGSSYGCARLAGGGVRCWGYNSDGQLGDGTRTDQPTPSTVVGVANSTAITAGGSHACALLADASVVCWGDNAGGVLGLDPGTTVRSTTPLKLAALTSSGQVSAGQSHTCAIISNEVHCLGQNSMGQLGNSSTDDSLIPVTVMGLKEPAQVSAGDLFTCAVGALAVKCWGSNAHGVLGDGTFTTRTTAVSAVDVVNAREVRSGHTHVLARTSQGAFAWGSNGAGELGTGDTSEKQFPTRIVW